jgi:hypothetical protein
MRWKYLFITGMFTSLFLYLLPCTVQSIVVHDFLVNTDSAEGIAQYGPDIAFDSSGNFVIVYSDRGVDHDFRQIYFQRFDSQASRLGGLNLVSDSTIQYNNAPKIAMYPSGSFVICWSSYMYQKDIQMRRYDQLGNPLGPPQQVDVDRPYQVGDKVVEDVSPYITMDKNGNFVVVWKGVDSTGQDIWAQQFDSEGNRIGNNFLVSDFDSSDYNFCEFEVYYPRAAFNSEGYLFIVWYGCIKCGGRSPGVSGARIYNPAGEPITKVFPLINSCASKWAYTSHPDIVSNSQNNFVFTSNVNDTVWTYPHGAILVQTFDTLGNPVDSGRIVNDVLDLGDFAHVSMIEVDDEDGYTVIWPDGRYQPQEYDLWAQRFSSSGEPQGQNYRINIPPESVGANWRDLGLSVYKNTVGITWVDSRNYEVYDDDVYAKLLELDRIGNYQRGDVLLDGYINVSDIIYLISYLFKSGWGILPAELGDVNDNGAINISDVVYLINYLFKSGAEPPEW